MGVFKDLITYGSTPAKPTYAAPSVTDWKNPRAGLGQDVLDFYKNYQGAPETVQSGKFAGMPQLDFNKMYRTPGSAYEPTKALEASNGSNMPGTVALHGLDGGESGYMYTPTTSNPGHRGDPYYVYNPDGSFREAKTFEKDTMSNPLVGVASVFGAAMGFGAIGAAAAGGGAAAAGGTAGAAVEAAPMTSFGVLDSGAAQLSAAGGFSAAPSMTTFGVLDQAAGYQSLAGPMGVTYGAAGVPTQFGYLNQAAGQMSLDKAAVGAGAGAGGGGGAGTGAGTGSGTGTGTAAGGGIASKLGLPAALDKLGGQALASGVSSIVGSMLSPKPDMSAPSLRDSGLTASTETKTKAVSEMPDPLAMQRSRKRSIIEQLGRRGRASTVLTNHGGRLGG